MPDLAVVIVSWNVRDLLRRCLASVVSDWRLVIGEWGRLPNYRAPITNHSALEVFVVDNASTDGTPEMVRREFSSVHLITNRDNLGFAAANNIALNQILHHASRIASYVWLLNPDTEVLPGATTALIAAMEAHSQVGVAGAKTPLPQWLPSAFRLPLSGTGPVGL